MSGPNNKVLVKMLDRLFASMVNGPSLNARPHASRQRVDFAQLGRLGDVSAEEALRRLLGDARQVRVAARVPQPKKRSAPRNGFGKRRAGETPGNGNGGAVAEGPTLTDAERAAEKAWVEQQALLTKLRVIADDARTYEQDTGVHVLNVGFPLLSLPPGSFDARQAGSTRRVLAPVAFIPVAVTLAGGATQNVQIACRGDGIDLVVPNNALLAWLEQQTGKPAAAELFADHEGQDPWREVCELVKHVCDQLDLEVPELFEVGKDESAPTEAPALPEDSEGGEPEAAPAVEQLDAEGIEEEVEAAKVPPPVGEEAKPQAPKTGIDALTLVAPPRADDEEDEKPRVVPAAVLGLFPMSNQGLLRDMQAMVGGEALAGPVKSFIDVSASFFDKPAEAPDDDAAKPVEKRTRSFGDERLVTAADPFQSRAVRLARESGGLVVHGPPGTGKSQTITNIIGDHLSRGQRVLLVCDKRTALDVVYNRLEHMGLGSLCALIHDPQRDQRELYKAVREQLEALPETKSDAKAEAKLAKVDGELQKLHAELTGYGEALMKPEGGAGQGLSLHELMGQWLALAPVGVVADVTQPEGSTRRDGLTPSPLAGEGGSEGERKSRPAQLRNSTPNTPPHPNPLPQGERGPDPHPGRLPEYRERGVEGGAVEVAAELAQVISLGDLEEYDGALRDILSRAGEVEFARNAWARAAGTSLADFLARPMESVRAAMNNVVCAARDADTTADPAIPPFAAGVDLTAHGAARVELAERMDVVTGRVEAGIRARWAAALVAPGGLDTLRRARQKLSEAEAFVATVRAGPLDAELALTVRDNLPDLSLIVQQAAHLARYEEVATKWWSFLAFGPKKQAAIVLNRYGLTLSPAAAERVRNFVGALRARIALRDLVNELGNAPPESAGRIPDDADLTRAFQHHDAVLDLLVRTNEEPALRELGSSVARALTDGAFAATFVDGLRKSPARAAALVKLEGGLGATRLFDPTWLAAVSKKLRAGQAAAAFLSGLAERLDTLEGVLRVREGLAALSAPVRPGAEALVKQSAPVEEGLAVLRREVLAAEIARRLRAAPHLQAIDGQKLRQMFDQYRDLDAKKKDLVRDAVLHRWVAKQQERLLAGTGSRLNGTGADLRRRLTIRGERAMRLRQVIAVGRGIEGGDPLFDLRPVWMASPETVAQAFPREAIFDVVVFDEASQCRLEEALPVLVRGKRVTIAGDPKQLPPTRFFESAVAVSDDDEVENDQQLFEMQQGETEDLLGAALGLDIQQSYLDVHYRSRSAELIEFSNEHFYGSRLQAIPGHPSRRPKLPPVRLVRADGTYDKGENEIEADRVVELVKELLARKDPPSIGVACFNLRQRDLIVEKLDELAAEDAAFGKKLADARNRRGAGSFDGLFVKNLENVQGDERDHIIVSTTYGADARGKFYRRFGPLGRAGGGRRLNVLVTRAREQVHVVTSIPVEAYRSLPEVPGGQTPGGGWLLFAYLKYAEEVGRGWESRESSISAEAADAKPQAAESVVAHPTQHPSSFAGALAEKLHLVHGVGAEVHWGNEGFCVDVAPHPAGGGPATVGVLCDASRFAESEDRTEWDVFRTGILEQQGWRLHRVWTPHFFRDPKGAVKAIGAAVAGGAGAAGGAGGNTRAAPARL